MPRRSEPSSDGAAIEEDRQAALRMMNVSRETEERLTRYVEMLRRWQTIKNLVGASTLPQVWTRHIADSAQLLPLAPDARRWVDLGSGAGFPSLVIAIQMQARRPDGSIVHLIESNGRKCAFLRDVIRDIGCPAVVHDARIEAVIDTLGDLDMVTSRALAPLPDLLDMARSLFEKGTSGIFLKTAAEIDAAGPAEWKQRAAIVPSRTSPDGRIVLIRPDRATTSVLDKGSYATS